MGLHPGTRNPERCSCFAKILREKKIPNSAFDLSTKPLVGLNTWPVGAESVGGNVTLSLDGWAVGPTGLTG